MRYSIAMVSSPDSFVLLIERGIPCEVFQLVISVNSLVYLSQCVYMALFKIGLLCKYMWENLNTMIKFD